MKTITESIFDVITGKPSDPEIRKQVDERNIMRDESHLKQIAVDDLSDFQKRELKSVSDKLFTIIGPDARKYKLFRDDRLEDDIEAHFPTPKTGITLTATDFSHLSRIKFFYINIGKDKIVVTFL